MISLSHWSLPLLGNKPKNFDFVHRTVRFSPGGAHRLKHKTSLVPRPPFYLICIPNRIWEWRAGMTPGQLDLNGIWWWAEQSEGDFPKNCSTASLTAKGYYSGQSSTHLVVSTEHVLLRTRKGTIILKIWHFTMGLSGSPYDYIIHTRSTSYITSR